MYSHLHYGIQVWGNATNITALTVLQKRAIKIINKSDFRGHTEPLFKSEEILTISDEYGVPFSQLEKSLNELEISIIQLEISPITD